MAEKMKFDVDKLLDHYREMRHSDQYSISFFATEDEVRNSLHSAENFVQRIRELLGIKFGKWLGLSGA